MGSSGASPEKIALPISVWPTRKSFLLSLAGKAVCSFDSDVFFFSTSNRRRLSEFDLFYMASTFGS